MKNPIEHELFTARDSHIDVLDDSFQMYDCCLDVQMGPYAPGYVVDVMAVHLTEGELRFYHDGEAEPYFVQPVKLALA
ncbi:MAG: hypothetical protein E6R04_01220 [Spirochaetes bacterium]|nr:MAG: hypothetical protein E6R04_01220 [Spirochaetota bacterium]